MKKKNIHPGEILLEEFLIPLGISAYKLSKDTGLPQTRISAIIKGNRRITADTALRLSKYFGNSAKFWFRSSGWFWYRRRESKSQKHAQFYQAVHWQCRITVQVLPQWGIWKPSAQMYAQKFIVAQLFNYFRQPPLRQYLVSGCPAARPEFIGWVLRSVCWGDLHSLLCQFECAFYSLNSFFDFRWMCF